MNHKKKISISLVLLGILLLAAPGAMQAQYSYTTNSDGISLTITGYSGPGGAVTIPTNINGLTVSSIAGGAFAEINDLASITIPTSVTSVEGGAFTDCFGLATAMISGSVTNIGARAFSGCTKLSILTLCIGITSIGDSAFFDCASLTNVVIPASVTNIGVYAFSDNPSLTSITIPGTVGSGNDLWDVFEFGPTNITKVTIEYGTTSIASNLFYDTSVTNVTLPASVASIGIYAFYDCQGLTTMTIPASVTNIGSNAFVDCNRLTGLFFAGSAPFYRLPLFNLGIKTTVYYLPGTSGWSNSFAGQPALLWNPQMQATGANFGVQNNQFGFDITGTTNIPIVVEACTNLASPAWTPLQSLTLTNGLFHFSEPLQTNSSGRFYRISSP